MICWLLGGTHAPYVPPSLATFGYAMFAVLETIWQTGIIDRTALHNDMLFINQSINKTLNAFV